MPADTAILKYREWVVSFVTSERPITVVDLGCGDGVDLVILAKHNKHPDSKFIGIDTSEKRLRAARDRVAGDCRIKFENEEINKNFPFETATLDVVFSNNLLECIDKKEEFVRETARVLRSDGVVIASHWDWGSQVFDSDDKVRARSLLNTFSDWKQPWMRNSDGWMGRRLWGLFNNTGLFEGEVHAHTIINTIFAPGFYGYARARDLRSLVEVGLADRAEVESFLKEQEKLSVENRYFYSLTGYVFAGKLSQTPK